MVDIKRIIKVLKGLQNFLRVFREGFLVFRYKFMRVLCEGLVEYARPLLFIWLDYYSS